MFDHDDDSNDQTVRITFHHSPPTKHFIFDHWTIRIIHFVVVVVASCWFFISLKSVLFNRCFSISFLIDQSCAWNFGLVIIIIEKNCSINRSLFCSNNNHNYRSNITNKMTSLSLLLSSSSSSFLSLLNINDYHLNDNIFEVNIKKNSIK